jgi:trk system potassium uptake protein TrkH
LFDLRPVLFANGLLLLVLAVAMGAALILDLAVAGSEAPAFAASMFLSLFVGGALALTGRGRGGFGLGSRQAFLFSASGTVLTSVFAALPLILGSRHLRFVDALFEAISGITTTGATVMTDLDHAPAALLLWRALLQWLGGAGVILAAMLLLPMLRIGGMQVFRMEYSSTSAEKVPRKLPRMLGKLMAVYCAATLLIGLGLRLAGMNGIEAACHAMAALSTGGFSTSDYSLARFGVAARWICVIGMFLGGMNLALFISSWRGKRWRILKDTQIRWYAVTALVFALLLAFWYWAVDGMQGEGAVQRGIFQSVSLLSTTGFRMGEDHGWGGFPQVAMFVLAFIGGCTGSAAGGIKIFRFEVLFAVSRLHVARMLHPHGVFFATFNRLRLPEAVLRSVLGFFMLYFVCFAVLSIGLAVCGLDPLSSLSASAAAMGNIGRGIGPVIGVSGGYHTLPDSAKLLLALGMLVGRLELAPLLVLLLPSYWKD